MGFMNSADALTSFDRCPRKAFFENSWQRQRLNAKEILRQSIETGLMSDEDDPGKRAGDETMTLASERGLDQSGSGLYATAMNVASLADLVVTLVRSNGPAWERPADTTVGTFPWVSSCFREESGVRLRRLVLASRWNADRAMAEKCSWYTIGECATYGLPMTITVCLIGQFRDNRFSNPFSKAWWHPSFGLRIRKRDGSAPKGFKPIWREEADTITRERWIEQMREDGVLNDVLFEVNYELPIPEIQAKIRHLAAKKLKQIQSTTETPDPTPSQCWWPTPCQFASECWQFREPSEKTGFLSLDTL